jgi:hypothetical protein
MAEIVNLRRVRKHKARSEREAIAAENRHKHGLTAAAKKQKAAEQDLAERRLASHLIERDQE